MKKWATFFCFSVLVVVSSSSFFSPSSSSDDPADDPTFCLTDLRMEQTLREDCRRENELLVAQRQEYMTQAESKWRRHFRSEREELRRENEELKSKVDELKFRVEMEVVTTKELKEEVKMLRGKVDAAHNEAERLRAETAIESKRMKTEMECEMEKEKKKMESEMERRQKEMESETARVGVEAVKKQIELKASLRREKKSRADLEKRNSELKEKIDEDARRTTTKIDDSPCSHVDLAAEISSLRLAISTMRDQDFEEALSGELTVASKKSEEACRRVYAALETLGERREALTGCIFSLPYFVYVLISILSLLVFFFLSSYRINVNTDPADSAAGDAAKGAAADSPAMDSADSAAGGDAVKSAADATDKRTGEAAPGESFVRDESLENSQT